MDDPVQLMLLGEASGNAEVGVLVWNAERRYVAANAKACALLGVTREELLDRPMGSTNRGAETESLIARALEEAPSQGVTTIGDREVGWLVFPTQVAGLDHVVGLMWETAAL